MWVENGLSCLGQKKSEIHHSFICYLFLFIGIIISYYEQKLSLGVYTVIIGTVIAGIVKK